MKDLYAVQLARRTEHVKQKIGLPASLAPYTIELVRLPENQWHSHQSGTTGWFGGIKLWVAEELAKRNIANVWQISRM
jgi:hypothetical protein